jgi:hypothetical protein
MSLKDALVHMIVECDTNTIRCNLLEFLVRTAFVWHWLARNPKEAKIALEAGDEEELSQDQIRLKQYQAFVFETSIFKEGMMASDFQATLQQITSMSMDSVQELLAAFNTEAEEHKLQTADVFSVVRPLNSSKSDLSALGIVPEAEAAAQSELEDMKRRRSKEKHQGAIFCDTLIKLILPEVGGNRVDFESFCSDEETVSWATKLKFRRLDGPSRGFIMEGHEVMLYSPEADRRLDIGMLEATSCDPSFKSQTTCFKVKPTFQDYPSTEPLKYEQEVGVFSYRSSLRMDIAAVATTEMDLSSSTTKFKVEIEPDDPSKLTKSLSRLSR